MKNLRLTRSVSRTNGINIEVMYIEAIQTTKSKRKIDCIERGGTAKKRKIETKPLVKPVQVRQNSNNQIQTQTRQNNCLAPTNEMAQKVIEKNDSSTVTNHDNIVAKIDFRVNEVVWAKIKGYPHWPAKIKRIDSTKMVTVYWFNDYRITKIYKTQLTKFLINFERYALTFDQHIGLKRAAFEALQFYGSNMKS